MDAPLRIVQCSAPQEKSAPRDKSTGQLRCAANADIPRNAIRRGRNARDLCAKFSSTRPGCARGVFQSDSQQLTCSVLAVTAKACLEEKNQATWFPQTTGVLESERRATGEGCRAAQDRAGCGARSKSAQPLRNESPAQTSAERRV